VKKPVSKFAFRIQPAALHHDIQSAAILRFLRQFNHPRWASC
jgi:hypothetical protein